MTVFVFCGPTIGPNEAQAILKAEYLPPAAQGDVVKAVARQPRAIGIIDGYFQSIPSLLHKEILWALDQGIHVFGSASMGALRAAELADFGMVGVGRIFEDYRDGRIARDDEVALNHGPQELGYPTLSEPLVNIRATLRAAIQQDVISNDTASVLQMLMGDEYFSYRSFPRMIDLGAQRNLPPEELLSLGTWIKQNKVDLKKEDAIEMLTCMRDFLSAYPGRFLPKFHLERTSLFDQIEP